MSINVKDLIKEVIKKDLQGVIKKGSMFQDGVKILISGNGDDPVRFDVPELEKAYVLMSGRLYERQYVPRRTEPAGKEQDAHALAEQLDYLGAIEKVDTAIFKNKITCKCGNVRWVKNSDLFQVSKCKPCTYRDRKHRRNQNRPR